MNMKLENKVAIVTGAGRGLGRGIALKLATEGAKVVVADMAPADETVALIEKSGGIASAFTVNVWSSMRLIHMEHWILWLIMPELTGTECFTRCQ